MQENEPQSRLVINGNRFNRYFQYAGFIISAYKGNEPFHQFLKRYFSENKKHGSRDRKVISSLCYNYLRLGNAVSLQTGLQEKFILSTFLFETKISLLLEVFKSEWNALIQRSLFQKIEAVSGEFNVNNIFPFNDELSNEIDIHNFNASFLLQPKLFLRIRPGFKETVYKKLKNANFFFLELSDHSLAFSDNQKITDLIIKDKEAVVQDYSSQQTLDFLKPLIGDFHDTISVWDCCAGSGGKSILAFDTLKNIKLTVSDSRKKILENCKLRFSAAGIKNYTLVLADLQKPFPAHSITQNYFDIIIADIPCTGSGTWSRTPEQLTFTDKKDIEKYAALQKKIIENAIIHLTENGYFLYITCSVFRKENEDNVKFTQQNFNLKLLGSKYIKGYQVQADTMFVALYQHKGTNKK